MADSDKRLRYFNGQFLQEKDFNDEQAYHLDRQRRHNQHLHTYGIADGLLVTGDVDATWVTVSPGTAIDGEGRMIVLPDSETVSFGSLTDPALVVISYGEQESDLASVGDKGHTRWWERPKLQVIAEADAPPPSEAIQLARLEIANGKLKNLPNTNVRTSAGKVGPGSLKVQNPLSDALQFVKDQNDHQSPIMVATTKVEINTESAQAGIFRVVGNIPTAPLMEVRNRKNEATIRYLNMDSADNVAWHVGTGGAGGPKNFFFWNQTNGVMATITPEGDLSVKGKILVAGTVDGRDVSADGAKLDTLASSTIEGVSNPGGNIDLLGQNGIFVSGDNNANTITIANAAGTLAAQNPLGPSAQFVRDQTGNQSSLAIGTGNVGIGTKDLSCVFTVAGNVSSAPIAEARSLGDEASIRYVNKDGVAWRAGSGGIGGAKNFSFWNDSTGPAGKAVATITPGGSLTVKDFNVSTDAPGIVLKIDGNAGTAPLAEVKNQGNEASIRYVCKDNVPWHIGTGGHGGVDNFFFWSQSNGVVGKIAPEGTLTLSGGLTVKNVASESAAPNPKELKTLMIDGAGQVYKTAASQPSTYMQRIVLRAHFNHTDPSGKILSLDAGFQPKLISLEGRVSAKLSGGLAYGGSIGGFCRCFDNLSLYAVGHGPHIRRFHEPPYLEFFNHPHEGTGNALGSSALRDTSQPSHLHVYIELIVESLTTNGFKVKLVRSTDSGCTMPEFGVDMIFAVLG